MELLNYSKGQSAIEYLTTYGWMLLVIAIVGGAIFTTVQDSSQVASVSGMANAGVQVDEFGITQQKGLQVEIVAATSDQVENANLSIKDEETGKQVYSCSEETIPVADTETVSIAGVESSENTNTYTIEINYDSGGLEGLTEIGSVTGRLELNSSVSCEDISEGGSSSSDGSSTSSADFHIPSVSDNGSVTAGETLGVNYTVDNVGGVSDTQDIVLEVNETQVDDSQINSLSGGDSSNGTLTWITSSDNVSDGISYNVSTENDFVTGSVNVSSDAVSRSDAIAAADAWYEPQSDGSFQQIKTNPGDGWPSSLNPGGNYNSTRFDGQGGGAIELTGDTVRSLSSPLSGGSGVVAAPGVITKKADSGGGITIGVTGPDGWPNLGADYEFDNGWSHQYGSGGINWNLKSVKEGSTEILVHGTNSSNSYVGISDTRDIQSNSNTADELQLGLVNGEAAMGEVAGVTGQSQLPNEIRKYFDENY